MKLNDLLKRAWCNLWKNKIRTIITTISTAIGVLSIIIMASIGGDIKDEILGGYIDNNDIYKIGIRESIEYTLDLEDLKSFNGVKSMSTVKAFNGGVKYKGNDISAKIILVDKETLENMDSYVVEGQSIKDINGAIISNRFNEEYRMLNDKCIIDNEENGGVEISIRVDGVLNTDTPFLYDNVNLNMEGVYPLIIYIPIERMEMEDNYERDDGEKIHYFKFENTKDLKKMIQYLDDNNYYYDSAYEKANIVNKAFVTIQIILGLLGGITLIISSITVANTMSMAIIERQKEIGILKAIGMRLNDIRKLFMIEAVYIASIGGFVGIVLSFPVAKIINVIFIKNIPEEAFNISRIINISPFIVIVIFIITILIIIISALSSVKKAVKIDVLETLREE